MTDFTSVDGIKEPSVDSTPLSRLFFTPSDKEPGARRAARLQNSQRLYPSYVTSDSALVREAYFEDSVVALGCLLFKCPPIIETMIEVWMSRLFIAYKAAPIEMLKYVFSTVATQRPALQLHVRRVVDYTSRPLSRICAISFFMDTKNSDASFDFECDDALLFAPWANFDIECSLDKIKARMALLISSIVSYDPTSRGGFLSTKVPMGVPSTVLSNFESNDLLRKSYDPSVFIVALLDYVLRYCESLSDLDPSDLGTLDDFGEEDARMETITDLMGVCDVFVREMRHRVNCVSAPGLALADGLLIYHGKQIDDMPLTTEQLNEENFVFGVPIEVICDPVSTLLWLEAMWSVERQESGLRRLISDLWRAKRLSITQDYQDRFQEWDAAYLTPVLEHFAQTLSEYGSQRVPKTGNPNAMPKAPTVNAPEARNPVPNDDDAKMTI